MLSQCLPIMAGRVYGCVIARSVTNLLLVVRICCLLLNWQRDQSCPSSWSIVAHTLAKTDLLITSFCPVPCKMFVESAFLSFVCRYSGIRFAEYKARKHTFLALWQLKGNWSITITIFALVHNGYPTFTILCTRLVMVLFDLIYYFVSSNLSLKCYFWT